MSGQRWYGKDEIRKMGELRNIDVREFPSGSEVGPQRDQSDLHGALVNLKTPEETWRERGFTIMVENAVEIWRLPLYWDHWVGNCGRVVGYIGWYKVGCKDHQKTMHCSTVASKIYC